MACLDFLGYGVDNSPTFRVFGLRGFSGANRDAFGHYWFNLKGKKNFLGSER